MVRLQGRGRAVEFQEGQRGGGWTVSWGFQLLPCGHRGHLLLSTEFQQHLQQYPILLYDIFNWEYVDAFRRWLETEKHPRAHSEDGYLGAHSVENYFTALRLLLDVANASIYACTQEGGGARRGDGDNFGDLTTLQGEPVENNSSKPWRKSK